MVNTCTPDGSTDLSRVKARVPPRSSRGADSGGMSYRADPLSKASAPDNRSTGKIKDEETVNSGAIDPVAIDSGGTALMIANPSDAYERSPARDVPWPIANPSVISRSRPGRRALWKRRQLSRINDAKINNDDDTVTESEAFTGLDAHTDASAMQLAAISRASFYQKGFDKDCLSIDPGFFVDYEHFLIDFFTSSECISQ